MLTAAAERFAAPRNSRLLVTADVDAAELSPVPVDASDAAARAAIPFTTPVGAGIDRVLAAEAAGTEWELRAVDLRSAPRVGAGEDDDAAGLALGPADPAASAASAKAAGAEANSPPAPNATARAPTRPTYRA